MPELYYAMCFNGNDEEKSKFYHCIALAENKEDFKASALKHKDVDFTTILTLTELLKETGFQKEILDLSQQVDDYNPIIFSDPIAFFTEATSDEEGKLLEDEARPNGIVTLDIKYQERDNFMKQAKAWLLREAGYECQDPRFPNIYTITDQEAAEKSMLLIDAPQFNAHLLLAHFGDKMHSLFEGNQALEMETVAPYLLGSTNIVDFITSLHDEPHSVWNEDKGIEYTSEKQYKGVMLIKTNKSLDEVRKRLRRFTRIKTPEDKWVYFRFAEQLTTQEWLINSEPEAASYFMEFIDEILFARCDTCSFHHIKTNKDKIIENPKYPNLNEGFLLTQRQNNALKLGRKEHIIGGAQAFLYKNFNDLIKERELTVEHIQAYLRRMWDNFHKAGGNTQKGFFNTAIIGIYLGVGYMFDPIKLTFMKNHQSMEHDELLSLDEQNEFFISIKSNPNGFNIIQKKLSLEVESLVDRVYEHFQYNQRAITIPALSQYIIENNHKIYRTYGVQRIGEFLRIYFDLPQCKNRDQRENITDALYATIWGIDYKNDTLVQGGT